MVKQLESALRAALGRELPEHIKMFVLIDNSDGYLVRFAHYDEPEYHAAVVVSRASLKRSTLGELENVRRALDKLKANVAKLKRGEALPEGER